MILAKCQGRGIGDKIEGKRHSLAILMEADCGGSLKGHSGNWSEWWLESDDGYGGLDPLVGPLVSGLDLGVGRAFRRP